MTKSEAKQKFLNLLAVIGKLNHAQAEHVFAVYRQQTAIIWNVEQKDIEVKHALLLTRETIRSALSMATGGEITNTVKESYSTGFN